MHLAEIIQTTRTCHRYKNQSVDPVFIEEALTLSLHAPNHKFTFPWQYYWLGQNSRDKIFELSLENLKQKQTEIEPTDLENLKEKILYPEILFFAKNKSEKTVTAQEDYATLACSVQLFALVLAEKGISYKWSTGGMAFDPRCHEIIGLDSNHEVIGMITCGYRKNNPGPFHRPELEKVIHRIN